MPDKDAKELKDEVNAYFANFALESIEGSIAEQKQDIRNLRNQASIVIAANGLMGNFLIRFADLVWQHSAQDKRFGGGQFLFGLTSEGFLLFLFFGLSVIFAIRVLWPSENWKFDVSPTGLIDHFEKLEPQSKTSAITNLCRMREKNFTHNEKLLASASDNLKYSLCFIAMQIPIWFFSVI